MKFKPNTYCIYLDGEGKTNTGNILSTIGSKVDIMNRKIGFVQIKQENVLPISNGSMGNGLVYWCNGIDFKGDYLSLGQITSNREVIVSYQLKEYNEVFFSKWAFVLNQYLLNEARTTTATISASQTQRAIPELKVRIESYGTVPYVGYSKLEKLHYVEIENQLQGFTKTGQILPK